jgi:hypothetical protein
MTHPVRFSLLASRFSITAHGLLLMAAVLALASCSSKAPGSRLAAAVIDTLPGGIIRVTNHGPTAWADTNGWKLVLERSIQPAENSPGQLNDIGDLVVDSKGRIFVLENSPVSIKQYAPDGTHLRSFGRDGSGPGEFHKWGMLEIAHDTIVQHDPGQSRTSAFTGDGEFVKVWTTLCCHSRSLAGDDSGRIEVPGTVAADSTGGKAFFGGLGIVRYRLDGTVVDTIRPQPQLAGKAWEISLGGGHSRYSIPFTPFRTERTNQAGFWVWGDPDRYQLIFSRHGPDTVRIVVAQADPVPLPDSARINAFNERVKDNADLKAVARLEDIPASYPLWTAFAFDGNDNLWVLLPGPKGAGDHWQVFDAEGRLLGAVPAPFSTPWRTFWTRDRVYHVEEGESGVPEIQVYRIVRGGAPD